MKEIVDPGSKSPFSRVRDRTAEMVSHTMMLSGVSLALLGKVAPMSCRSSVSSSSSNTGKAYSTLGSAKRGKRTEHSSMFSIKYSLFIFLLSQSGGCCELLPSWLQLWLLLTFILMFKWDAFPARKVGGLLFSTNLFFSLVTNFLTNPFFAGAGHHSTANGSPSPRSFAALVKRVLSLS
jgi:hypothetical protein